MKQEYSKRKTIYSFNLIAVRKEYLSDDKQMKECCCKRYLKRKITIIALIKIEQIK